MNNFRFTQLVAIGLLSATCGPTYATQLDVQTVEELLKMPLEELMQIEVVSEATGSKQVTTKAPAIIKVITAEDIKKMGATDLDEVLETVPELHVTHMLAPYHPSYLIRGMVEEYNQDVILLINNIPLNTIQYGDRHRVWGGMPVNTIARIEVIRGAGAAVHANAFTGAINIVTKTAEDIDGTETGIRLGDMRTNNIWALHGGQYGGFKVAAAWEYVGTEGVHKLIDADRQTMLDQKFGTHVSLAPGPMNSQRDSHELRVDIARDHWRWRTGLQKQIRVGSGVGLGLALDPDSYYNSYRFNSDLTYSTTDFADHWEMSAQLSYLDTNARNDTFARLTPPGSFGGLYPEGQLSYAATAERQWRANWSAFYTGLTNHTWRLETGYTKAEVYKVTQLRNFDVYTNRPLPNVVDFSDTPAAYLPEKGRWSQHFLLQDAWTLTPTWELSAGLRYYDYSDFGRTFNPLVGLVWQTRPNLVTKLLYGKAFRAPSMIELYTNTVGVIGNPQLKAETIHTVEGTLNYQASKTWQVDFDTFFYQVQDAIVFLPTASGKTQSFNEGSKTGYGVGLETVWQLNHDWQWLGNYSFQMAHDENDHLLPNVPRQELYIRTDWAFRPAWTLDMQANWVGRRYRAWGDTRPPVDNYTTIGLTLRYQPTQQPWEIGVSVHNLFDTDAREPASTPLIPKDLPLAGRNLWGEVRYRF